MQVVQGPKRERHSNGRARSRNVALADYQTDGKAASLLREQLDSIYGDSFAGVVGRELKSTLGLELYDALRARPSEAVGVLREMFRRDKTVVIIVDALVERLNLVEASPQRDGLIEVLEKAKEATGPTSGQNSA